MAIDHPFQQLFETLGRVPTSHAESVNRQAYEILSSLLAVPVEKAGRCILLRAPRGGHGKTHLLSRIQHELGGGYEFIPLQPVKGCQIDAATVTDDILRRLLRQVPAGAGLTVLDELTRRLFAIALQPLVISGDVPCQDRDGALTALRQRPIETFDFHHPSAVTAHWALENSEVLGQRLASELALRSGLAVSGIAFWVEALFRFASAPLDHSSRIKALIAEVHGAPGLDREHLESLLGLLTQLIRVVLVADDVEGFSTDEPAALRFAAFLGSLRHSVQRVDVILSLNQDIWASAFLPRLSSGLTDRLTEVIVELAPLTEEEMAALLDSRVPGLGSRLLGQIDLASSGSHARGLIRAAGMAWLKATALDSRPSLAITPSAETLQLVKTRLPHEPPPLPAWTPEAEPEAEVEPAAEVMPEPELTTETELTPESELAPEPELIPEPEFTPEPELLPEPELTPEPELAPEPEVVPAIELVPAVELVPEPEIVEKIEEIASKIETPPIIEAPSRVETPEILPPSEIEIPEPAIAPFWPSSILTPPAEFVPAPPPQPPQQQPVFPPPVIPQPVIPTPVIPAPVISPFTVVSTSQLAPLTPLVGQVIVEPISIAAAVSVPPPEPPVVVVPPVEFAVVSIPPAEVAEVPTPSAEPTTAPIAPAEPAVLEASDTDHLDSLLRRFRERFRGDGF